MIAYFAFGTTDAIALGAKAGIFFWIALALIVSVDGHARPALLHEDGLGCGRWNRLIGPTIHETNSANAFFHIKSSN